MSSLFLDYLVLKIWPFEEEGLPIDRFGKGLELKGGGGGFHV